MIVSSEFVDDLSDYLSTAASTSDGVLFPACQIATKDTLPANTKWKDKKQDATKMAAVTKTSN